MEFLKTPWPNLRLYAQNCGVIDPYDPKNALLFRGEEAFAPEITGWRRWSKPSPEPRLDEAFEPILLDAIAVQAPVINALTRELALKISAANSKAPVLVAALRAGVPICALLAPILEEFYGQTIPICAFSLFYGLGWDERALEKIVADFPDRPLIFVDGWTSGGGVATQIEDSFSLWKASGKPDFSDGQAPQFAVLCDPRGKATFSALKADFFVPSAVFTAPETLGFSRGFAFESGNLFGVYAFPRHFQKPAWIAAWLQVLNAPVARIPLDDAPNAPLAPPNFRVHVNEVIRASINRDPLEVWLRDDAKTARKSLAPLLYLAQNRGVAVEFERGEVETWGAVAAARMK